MSIDRIMAALSIFSKICQKFISLADIFELDKCQGVAFINVLNVRSSQQGSRIDIQVTKTFVLP